MTLHVGIDVGGTFTDAVAILDGRAVRGKAFSTKDVTTGILGALGVLQDRLHLTEADFFPAVDRLVLGAWDPAAGAAGSLRDVVRDRRLNHRVEVVGGVLAEECAGLLRTWFEGHRTGP